jgi:hypothetical protein
MIECVFCKIQLAIEPDQFVRTAYITTCQLCKSVYNVDNKYTIANDCTEHVNDIIVSYYFLCRNKENTFKIEINPNIPISRIMMAPTNTLYGGNLHWRKVMKFDKIIEITPFNFEKKLPTLLVFS